MKYRILGNTKIKVSEIGFGAWPLGGTHWGKQDDRESLKALLYAADNGVNFIETAAAYGRSEEVIKKFLELRKDKIYIATKIPPLDGPWPPSPYCKVKDRFPASYIRKNVDERLKSLNVESIDILLLHTWTRAWNDTLEPLEILQQLKKAGKINFIGIQTPEHDQNCLLDIMKERLVDVVNIIYNIFEQEPAAELLPIAKKNNIGVMVRAPFDEGSLTGNYSKDTVFEEGDFRRDYFSGDRLKRTLIRVEKIYRDINASGLTLSEASLLFIINQSAVHCVSPGMRNIKEVESNIKVSELKGLSDGLIKKLQNHYWLKSFWYFG